MEGHGRYIWQFLEGHTADNMLKWKASFDSKVWYEDRADISQIFVFVINAFTWDF